MTSWSIDFFKKTVQTLESGEKEIIMNKSDLVDALSKDSGLTKLDSEKAINSFIGIMEHALKNGEVVTLVGFGSFSVKLTAGRSGRNFKTGASINIPPRNSVRFKPGKNLKECVN
ncbi:MAG: HU family DNA-binding protein [Holosporaceae bacterium]|jgi:DNA-binding protein HU-beta|nr:HU family DNA-binding protein [Holosporaceae bacterium]